MPRLELASAISSNRQGSHITFSIFLIRYVLVLACESYYLGSLPNPDILIHLDSFPDELEDKEKVNARSTYVFSSGMFQYMVVYAPLVSYIFLIFISVVSNSISESQNHGNASLQHQKCVNLIG